MIVWQGGKGHPLGLDTKVRVRFRDGDECDKGTVADWYGEGGGASNWFHFGEPEDIVAYEELR